MMKALGSPELFMLSVLGITFMVPLVTTNPLKGMIAGGLGLFLATVGIDPIEATPRYTLGTPFLWDGIGLLPVTLGLLALPEALTLAGAEQMIAATGSRLSGAVGGMKESLRHWKLVIRCSAIGTAIGLLPGIGAAVAQWVAYGHAAEGSVDKARFGKGAIEGIVAPSAANNATLGGALVPTLAFGVPGSVSTAVLLGALILKGIVPGPLMLVPESQGGQLMFVFSLVWFMVVANVIAVAICLLLLNQLAKITRVRGALLVPFILFLICLGAFSEKNTVEDFLVLAFLGALGFLMVRLDWPRAPLLLGLVLGPLAENRLFLSTAVYGGLGWLSRPGVILISIAIVLGLARPLSKFQKSRRSASARSDPGLLDTTFTVGIAIALATALWHSQTFPSRAALFPRVILVFTLGLSLFQIARLLYAGFGPRGGLARSEQPERSAARDMFLVFVWFLGFLLAIWLFGFVVGGPLSIFLYLALAARERWGYALVLTTPAFLFVYVVMDCAECAVSR